MQRQFLAFGQMCNTCGKQNHFWVVCQNSREQKQMRPTPQQPTCMHDTHKEEELTMPVPSQIENDKNFDSVSMETLTFHSVKSVIFTRLQSSTSQKRTKIVYKVDL